MLHSEHQVLPLNIPGRKLLGLTNDLSPRYRYYSSWGVTACSLYSGLNHIMPLDCPEPTFGTEGPFNSIRVGRECIGGHLWRTNDAGAQVREEGAAILATPLAHPIGDNCLAGPRNIGSPQKCARMVAFRCYSGADFGGSTTMHGALPCQPNLTPRLMPNWNCFNNIVHWKTNSISSRCVVGAPV